MEVKNGPIARAQRRKFKMLEDNGMQGSIKGNKLEEKLAKSLKESTLLPTVALSLPSLVRFFQHHIWKMSTYCGRCLPIPTKKGRNQLKTEQKRQKTMSNGNHEDDLPPEVG
ncbi:hypothetical protein M9H77_23287 [Catharanthus roseus]|uniref:Uncharacterized protein n=1 Tax=Catharanthus roseus TaxID=4058 RepID=A0ACC0ATT7_CATRO|nr:hypothetical protein M9H77_23287 [Catharanthus roseus]